MDKRKQIRTKEAGMPKLLTMESAAQALSISRATAYELARRGQLRTIAIGRSRRVTEAEIERFIASREAEAAATR
jgi:excisionase family DNA binding protein